MAKTSYKELTIDDIDKELEKKQLEIQSYKFKVLNNSLKDIKLINKTKKEVAKLLTEKRSKEIEASDSAEK